MTIAEAFLQSAEEKSQQAGRGHAEGWLSYSDARQLLTAAQREVEKAMGGVSDADIEAVCEGTALAAQEEADADE